MPVKGSTEKYQPWSTRLGCQAAPAGRATQLPACDSWQLGVGCCEMLRQHRCLVLLSWACRAAAPQAAHHDCAPEELATSGALLKKRGRV